MAYFPAFMGSQALRGVKFVSGYGMCVCVYITVCVSAINGCGTLNVALQLLIVLHLLTQFPGKCHGQNAPSCNHWAQSGHIHTLCMHHLQGSFAPKAATNHKAPTLHPTTSSAHQKTYRKCNFHISCQKVLLASQRQ